jgi:hypothetical protein
MSKRHRNAPGPGHYKVQGHPVEDNDVASLSKQALVRESARLKRRVTRKKAAAPARTRAAAAAKVDLAVPRVLEREHDRDFQRMNERRPAKRVKPSAADGHAGYFSDAARGVLRRVARVALAPLSLARAGVDRFRDHD